MSEITLKSIKRETVVRPPRIVLLGVEKIGKSSFAADADDPIFIPINLEEGIDDLDVPKFPTCKSLDDVIECITVLATEDHNYKTVVIDSASALEPLIWKAVCDEANADSIEVVGGGYGKGYTEALSKWRDLMTKLDYLRNECGMASIIIGHVKVKRFDDPERESYDTYQMDINDKVSAALYRWSDCILFANRSVSVVKEDAGFNKKKTKAVDDEYRVLCTQKSPAHPGGGRGVFGRLDPEIELSYAAFREAVAEQVALLNKSPKKTKK